MTGYEFGDVVLVRFPFTDQITEKKRPAVVISSATYGAERPELIILAITSRVRPTMGVGETPVACWREAGLLKPSVFKPLITTIEKGLVLGRLGTLTTADRTLLGHLLRTILGN